MNVMEMSFKEDWEDAAKRFEGWWGGEIIERVAIQVTAPRANVEPKPVPAPENLYQRWTDIDYLIACAEERFRTTFFGGEAFPILFANLGPDVFSAYLGCKLIFRETTSWAVPIIKDWDTDWHPCFDPSNEWWQLHLKMTEAMVEWGEGKCFVGITDLHGGGDALSAMRGREELCRDLIDRPEIVKQAMSFLTPLWFEIYEGFHQLIQRRFTGSSTWLSVWSPGRYYPVSCDFIGLISPKMMHEFILPDLLAEIEWLDHSLFHLDGPCALPHLDALLDISKLNGIQWVPGAGSPGMLHWIPLLKRIQKAGKNLHLSVAVSEVEPLLCELSHKGLMLATSCTSQEEAKELLKKAVKWTRDR